MVNRVGLWGVFSLILTLSISSFSCTASGHEDDLNPVRFNPGPLIMHHVKDAHEWHLFDLKSGPVSIPLPIIIFDKQKGWSLFMSSKFSHGTVAYHNYILDHEHIVAIDAAGNKDEKATANIIDLSITKNVAGMLFCIALLFIVFVSAARAYKRKRNQAPKGIQAIVEPLVVFVRDNIAKEAIGEKHYRRFVPFLLTVFFFIWFNNLLGLIPIFPGGANVTGNIAIPLVLAFCTFIIATVVANKHFWLHILAMPGVPKPVLIILTPIEILGIFIRPIVLMIRLFANILAGHIVLLVFFCLIFVAGTASQAAGWLTAIPSVAFTIFINVLELLVGFLQAFVFTFLSAVYFGMAVKEPEHH